MDNFLLAVVANIVGAFTGFLMAMTLQRSTERRRRSDLARRIMSSARDELSQTADEINDYVNRDEVFAGTIQVPAWTALSYSGLIVELFDSPAYQPMVEAYMTLQQCTHSPQHSMAQQRNLFKTLRNACTTISKAEQRK